MAYKGVCNHRLPYDRIFDAVAVAAFNIAKGPIRALHVPCGDGMLSARMVRMGWDVTCADSVEMNLIRTSQSLAEAEVRASLLKAALPSLPLNDGSYDISISMTGAGPAELRTHVKELVRVTKPGGMVIIGYMGTINDMYEILGSKLHVVTSCTDSEVEPPYSLLLTQLDEYADSYKLAE